MGVKFELSFISGTICYGLNVRNPPFFFSKIWRKRKFPLDKTSCLFATHRCTYVHVPRFASHKLRSLLCKSNFSLTLSVWFFLLESIKKSISSAFYRPLIGQKTFLSLPSAIVPWRRGHFWRSSLSNFHIRAYTRIPNQSNGVIGPSFFVLQNVPHLSRKHSKCQSRADSFDLIVWDWQHIQCRRDVMEQRLVSPNRAVLTFCWHFCS